MRSSLSLCFILCLASRPCQAHGLVISISTPLIAPAGYEIHCLLSFALFALLSAFSAWKIWGMRPLKSLIAGLAATLLGAVFSMVAGGIFGEPSLTPGRGSAVLPGLPWDYYGERLLIWNLVSILCMTLSAILVESISSHQANTHRSILCWWLSSFFVIPIGFIATQQLSLIWVFFGIAASFTLMRNVSHRIAFVCGIFLIPVFALFPHGDVVQGSLFVALHLLPILSYAEFSFRTPDFKTILLTGVIFCIGHAIMMAPLARNGALVSGWEGGYFTRSCTDRLALLGTLLKRHSDLNGGRLPQAQTIQELVRLLRPLITSEDDCGFFADQMEYCPRTVPYSTAPVLLSWNASCSGKLISEIELFPVMCPANLDQAQLGALEECHLRLGLPYVDSGNGSTYEAYSRLINLQRKRYGKRERYQHEQVQPLRK